VIRLQHLEDFVIPPSELALGAVCCFGEDSEVGDNAERGERRWPCDFESLLDDPRGEYRLLEGEVDELIR
jgi:hypothetical protein